ncbi:MAG: glycosyltransferase family 4 protein [Deltaproteobacteria bacterium]|nr:glycosyltransferase family 4 protein [Deltaproteobacteria bacterium]
MRWDSSWSALVRAVLQFAESGRDAEIVPHLRTAAEQCALAGDHVAACERVKLALHFDNRDLTLWDLYGRTHRPEDAAAWPGRADIVFYTGHPFGGRLPFPSELAHCPTGGSESVLLLMAQTLAALGQRVIVFGQFPEARHDAGVYCFPLLDFFPYQRAHGLPVCIVSRFYQPFLNEFRAARRIFWLHDIVMPNYRALYQRMDAQVDEYWMLSAYQQHCYVERCGIAPTKCWQTTNAIDPQFFPAPLSFSQRRRGQLVYTSRPSRGLGILLRAFAALRAVMPNCTLHVCTYTPHAVREDPELRPFLAQLDDPAITVAAYGKQALAQLLRESHVYLYPNTSELETSCLAAIEAMAAGTPVVTSDRGCLRETVPHPCAGTVIPWSADEDTLTQQCVAAVRPYLQDESIWQAAADAAYAHAMQRHDAHGVARQWLRRLGF